MEGPSTVVSLKDRAFNNTDLATPGQLAKAQRKVLIPEKTRSLLVLRYTVFSVPIGLAR